MFRCGSLHVWPIALLLMGGGCQLVSRKSPQALATFEVDSNLNEGRIALQQGELDRAEALTASAIRARPDHKLARQLYADIHWRRGNREAAVRQLETCRNYHPDDVSVRLRLGAMRLRVGQLYAALEETDHALELQPQHAPSWQLRAQILQALGDSDQALANLHRATDLDPDNRDLFVELAEIYHRRGQPHRAAAVARSGEQETRTR